MTDRQQMIDKLVGVKSSKQNYYTQLKISIAELQKKNTQLEIINDVMRSFNVEMSMDEMLKNILEKLKKIFSFDRLSLFQYEREKDQLIITNVYPKRASYLQVGTDISREGSLYWEVMETGHYCNYLVREEDHYLEYPSFCILDLKQVLIFPLYAKGKIIGMFSLGSKDISTYGENDISFFKQLSDQLAVSLENMRLYQEVFRGKKEWEQTFSAVKDAILLVDADGKVIQMNEAGKKLAAARQMPQQVFESIDTLVYGEKQVEHSVIQKCLQTKQPTYEAITWDNKSYYEVYAYPVLNEQHDLFHMIVYMKNVTKKREYEVQIMQSGKLAAIGEMAAGVAHELNNPLTAILGNAQLLLRKEDQQGHSYALLHDIFECGKRCQYIIRNLLTFSRQDEYLFEHFSIHDALDKVLSLIGYQIKQQHITLEVSKDEHVPQIDGSIQQIEQVIINLLINAKDAILEKNEEEKVISIETSATEDWVSLSVIDNGIGMTEDEQQNMFNPFFTTKNTTKGTGLGLSVSLGIAESHGGKIIVQSKAGEGSNFTLQLPVPKEGD